MSKRLRAAREDANLTQRQLGELIGMSLKSVNNYENPLYAGHRKAVYVREWARVTGREFADIWGSRTPRDQRIASTRCRMQSPVAA
jgi:transcriptional regulator with XRE-family HTH domain